MMIRIAMGAIAGAALAFAGAASAQTPTHAETGLPFCSATVKDRCIQKVDLRREGKPVTVKK